MKDFINNHSRQILNTTRYLLLALYLLLVIFLLYAMLYFVFSSKRFTRSFYQAAVTSDLEIGVHSSELCLLKARNSFLNARMGLANEDSLSFTVDLSDSTITLEQKGVVLHTTKISNFQVSRIFKNIDQDVLSHVLADPLSIHQTISTISKTRYSIKVAPSDTSEFTPLVLPDTATDETVCFFFELDWGIGLDIRQAGASGNKTCKDYQRQINNRQSKRALRDLLAFRVPEFYPVIRIDIPEKDARTIYKALPIRTKLALRI